LESSESSVSDIWSNSFALIPKNSFNFYFSKIGILLGLLPLINGPLADFHIEWNPFVSLMLQVYASLLGFIIAGYTLFIASPHPKFQLAYWRHQSKGVSLLRLHFLIYMKLFLTVFIGTILFGLLAILFQIWTTLGGLIVVSDKISIVVQVILLSSIGWSMSGAAVQMKVMIFNLYSFSMTQMQFIDATESCESTEAGGDVNTER